MRVFLFAWGWDTAGQQAALRHAINRERPSWQVDQMARREKSYAYPRQFGYDRHKARKLWNRADVVHLNKNLDARDNHHVEDRPIVVHHHGSEYRDRREAMDARERDVTQVVSTLDLLGSPGVQWLPNVADLDRLAGMRARQSVVRIAHSPTNQALKGTDAILDAIERLHDWGLHFEFDLIENVTWTECLARKARADIFVDQLGLGYGLSAIEAWGMGIPVVAGVADPLTRSRMLDTFGVLPFVDATEVTLALYLAELVNDVELRAHWGKLGREHAERFHSESAVVERLDRIYQQATRQAVAA